MSGQDAAAKAMASPVEHREKELSSLLEDSILVQMTSEVLIEKTVRKKSGAEVV